MKFSAALSFLLLGQALALPTAVVSPGTDMLARRAYLDTLAKKRSTPVNKLLSLIVSLFPVNIAVDKITDLITVAEQGLALALGIDTTENGLAGINSGGSKCAGITIIFARGTTEAGNVGAIVGPPFFDAVRDRLSGGATLAIQGVEYPADVPGYLKGGDAGGSRKMADYVSSALQACPNTKLVMSGYSQGGQIVHNAAALLPADTMAKVSSVVIFGDPYSKKPVAGASAAKTLIICHAGDNICDGGAIILLPHITYAENADQAASFVIAQAGAISS